MWVTRLCLCFATITTFPNIAVAGATPPDVGSALDALVILSFIFVIGFALTAIGIVRSKSKWKKYYLVFMGAFLAWALSLFIW